MNEEALIKLLDDPDKVVFETVSQKILEVGPAMLPELEQAARDTLSPVLHGHIEELVKILQFAQLKTEFREWLSSRVPKLIHGAWLMTRYQFPDMKPEEFTRMIKPMREAIWLEISESLTAIEKIRVFNRLFFDKGRIRLNEKHPESAGNNFINRVLESGKANEHSLVLLYAIVAQELDLPVYVVEMPEYPILAYVDMPLITEASIDPELFDVLFYINPGDKGSLHSRDDITTFLIRQSLPLKATNYEPRPNIHFIRICLERLAEDYVNSDSEIRSFQVQDLLALWK
ncbi:MAG: transglutaminase family protein [Bacteroidales bacterium]|jgi:hypothetical protein